LVPRPSQRAGSFGGLAARPSARRPVFIQTLAGPKKWKIL